MNNFKVGDRVYCMITLKSFNTNDILISPGIYTISGIMVFSNGISYKLKEFESTNSPNMFNHSCFISISEMRKFKITQINKNEN